MVRILQRFAIVALAAIGLSGCFQPVYAPGLSGTAPILASIEVSPIEGQLGHQVKSELDFLLTNGTPPVNPTYRMTVAPKGTSTSVIVDVSTYRPQVMTYVANATYALVEIKTGKLVTSGSAQVNASFDRSQQRFATVRAIRDAEIRAGKMLAEQIRARIIPSLSASSLSAQPG